MWIRISCEHFSLTPPIREHVEACLQSMEGLPRLATVEVHLVLRRPHDFHVLMRTRYRGRDLISHVDGSNLYAAVHAAAATLEHRLHERMRKFTQQRRKRYEVDLSEIA